MFLSRTFIGNLYNAIRGLLIVTIIHCAALSAIGQEPAPLAEDPPVTATDERDEAYDEIKIFTEVLLHIKKQYVDEKSYKEIVGGGLHGILQSLDPHSDFLDAEAFRAMQEDTTSRFGGIGINIGMRNGLLTVIAPIEGTPAFKAGLLSGDVIVEIDREKTQGLSLRDAVKRLRGEKGEQVTIKIHRAGEDGPLTFDIIRDDIKVPSVKGTRIVKDGIGYIRLTQFSAPTSESLKTALDELLNKDMKALVLDLRSNHGGLLRSAIDVAQQFLERGTLVVTTKGRPGVHNEIKNLAGGNVHYTDFPMAVLVNGGSASASEILAGALQDHKRAILIGQTTYGKASVQSLIKLKSDDRTAIRLTIAHYYTPKGREIHGVGIEPDIVIKLSPKRWQRVRMRREHVENPPLFSDEDKKKYEHVIDPHLQRAVDVLQAMIIFQKE